MRRQTLTSRPPRFGPHTRSERGQAAGVETIPFGILVFIAGLLLVVNVWASVDARMAADAAARDYLRAYTAAATVAEAQQEGAASARRSLAARIGASARATVAAPTQPFGPCLPATVRIDIRVPAIAAPFLGTFGERTVTATLTELVQPFGDARATNGTHSLDGTACAA
jgi:hypothetical protein